MKAYHEKEAMSDVYAEYDIDLDILATKTMETISKGLAEDMRNTQLIQMHVNSIKQITNPAIKLEDELTREDLLIALGIYHMTKTLTKLTS